MECVDPELRSVNQEEEHLPGTEQEPIEYFPHAALALAKASSTAATWGSASSLDDSTTDPGNDTFQDLEDVESAFSDDDVLIVGPVACTKEEKSELIVSEDQQVQAFGQDQLG